jgi:LL-diaminopimelate aminotransferase
MEEFPRIKRLPPYVFNVTGELKLTARRHGEDVIDFSMGNPDGPTPSHIVEKLIEAVQRPDTHRYSVSKGIPRLRRAICNWYKTRYDVDLDPDSEAIVTIGSKEGLAHLALAYINPGDTSLVPSPSYPVHTRGTIMAGGKIETLPLTDANDYQLDFDAINREVAQQAKMLFFNYPHNPTAAVAERPLYEKAVAFAHETQTLLVHDMAYAELAFDGFKPTSLLEIPGAKDLGLEFHTFSKTFSMAGWRCGFVVGNASMIAALTKVKSNMDYGLFPAVQDAALAALNLPEHYVTETIQMYKERRDVVVDGFNAIGFNVKRPRATMYVWVPVPKGFTSASFASRLIEETGVVVTPGTAFGTFGEGHVRVSLIQPPDRLKEAIARVGKLTW